MVNSKCYLINTMEKQNERGLMKNEKIPDNLLTEIKKEVWRSFERSLSKLSKEYSTDEYEMIIGFDKNGITAERVWLWLVN